MCIRDRLNDEQLRDLGERLTYLRNLEDKKAQVISSIEEQGKLTEELKAAIEAAQTQVAVAISSILQIPVHSHPEDSHHKW